MEQPKYIKIGADGQQLPADAKDWVAVHLPVHGLTFSATSVVNTDVPQEKCLEACKGLSLAGHSDWDLPTVDELQLLIDRSRCEPAIDTDFFQDIQNDWYWSSTPAAWSASSAWLVSFRYGGVSYGPRYDDGFALAVRRAGQ
ncbi:DUF1566 domain-containing protein [Pseudoxanthomonas winnipegensis]|uniref:DUF1566 domain-containing protein n=1 Tax=Pseudoxanthomonas winnipegensis TaxID=2480810 RepID=A0A4Q8LFJ7_9GAMM|nr:DUF1566 domain-containing protein [Pseudoxanthomonas winnipegensis]TAA27638.1 DUF1566 domain-containing protein [Pseudoxanthomonas winnipegensis]